MGALGVFEENESGIMDETARATAKRWAAEVVLDAQKEGFDITSIKEQLYTMGWPRPTA